MCPIIEEYAKEYAKECINEYNLQMAVNLLKIRGITCTNISKCTKLSIEEIVNLATMNGLSYWI